MAELKLAKASIPAARGRVPGLDGLRALSIGIVLLGHFFMGEKSGFSSLGVYVFFVISGFLISRLMFSEYKGSGKLAVGAFYGRRVIRLYPVLIVYVAAMVVLTVARGKSVPGVEVASIFLYFANYLRSWQEYFHAVSVMPYGTLWSLAVEEHFYLLFPFAFVALRGDARRLLWLVAAVTLASLAFRYAYLIAWPSIAGTDYIYRLSETRADSIAAGVLLACLCELPRADRIIEFVSSRRMLAIGAIALLASYAPMGAVFKDTLRYDLRNIFCFALVGYVVFGQHATMAQRLFNWAPVAWVGVISYSIYIWHGMMGEAFAPLGLHGVKQGAVLLTATVVAAIASYYLVEKPCLTLKRYLPSARANQGLRSPASENRTMAAAS